LQTVATFAWYGVSFVSRAVSRRAMAMPVSEDEPVPPQMSVGRASCICMRTCSSSPSSFWAKPGVRLTSPAAIGSAVLSSVETDFVSCVGSCGSIAPAPSFSSSW
jgi:hypothetical protein